jgi:putative membrane protein
MVFIDDVALELLTIAFAGLLTLYMTIGAYWSYRKRGGDGIYDHIRSGIIPIAVIGTVILVLGLFGEMTWPLPASYNTLFYDPYVMLGVILVGFTMSVAYRQKLHYVGLLSFVVGLMTIFYGVYGYTLGLTQSPLALLGLYLCFGLAGIFAFPATLIIDSMIEKRTMIRAALSWKLILILFWLSLLAATLLAALIGGVALPAHLLSAP